MDIIPAACDGSRHQGGKTHRVTYSSDAGNVDRKLIQVPRGDLDIVLWRYRFGAEEHPPLP